MKHKVIEGSDLCWMNSTEAYCEVEVQMDEIYWKLNNYYIHVGYAFECAGQEKCRHSRLADCIEKFYSFFLFFILESILCMKIENIWNSMY